MIISKFYFHLHCTYWGFMSLMGIIQFYKLKNVFSKEQWNWYIFFFTFIQSIKVSKTTFSSKLSTKSWCRPFMKVNLLSLKSNYISWIPKSLLLVFSYLTDKCINKETSWNLTSSQTLNHQISLCYLSSVISIRFWQMYI